MQQSVMELQMEFLSKWEVDEKSEKLGYILDAGRYADMSSSNTQVQQAIHQNINTTTDADQNSTFVALSALISQLQKTVEDLASVV